MIVPVPYRYDLMGVEPPATPSGEDSQVPLSKDLVQEVELQQAHRGLTINLSQTVRAVTSFGTGRNLDVGASAAAQVVTVATLGKAFWQLYCCLSFNGSFVPAFTQAADEVTLQLVDPTGVVSFGMLHGKLATNFPLSMNATLRILLVEDGFTIRLSVPATGVGQSMTIAATVLGSKLL